MTIADDRWKHVRGVFERAIEQQPHNVDAWFDREGVTDWEIREEVLSLLKHHAAAGSFLAEPAGNQLAHLIADPTYEPGHAVGPYLIEREVGRGGMGLVYLATDTRLGRRVALKVLPPEWIADPARRERLRREARAAAALTHPGICTVHALEELDGQLVIATEFVEGHTLREEIARGAPPTSGVAMRTAQDLAAALAHAHERGIAHRDLKPENVMRTKDGSVKILDFGLARVDAVEAGSLAEGQHTQAGAIMGTPAYMAPEQLNGERADARADVFAYGVLLYELACGRHPFQASTSLALTAGILDSEPSSFSERRPDLAPPLADVISCCLRKAPADRYTSAVDIVQALRRTEPVVSTDRMTSWWRTHQLVVITMYFVAVALAWQVKEWNAGLTTAVFFIAGITATIAGVFRGHLLFTERVNRPRLAVERRRAVGVTLLMDIGLAGALLMDGLMISSSRPVAAVLTIGLGIGVALARLVLEPATTSGSFNR